LARRAEFTILLGDIQFTAGITHWKAHIFPHRVGKWQVGGEGLNSTQDLQMCVIRSPKSTKARDISSGLMFSVKAVYIYLVSLNLMILHTSLRFIRNFQEQSLK
jgi:hypothetical protein